MKGHRISYLMYSIGLILMIDEISTNTLSHSVVYPTLLEDSI